MFNSVLRISSPYADSFRIYDTPSLLCTHWNNRRRVIPSSSREARSAVKAILAVDELGYELCGLRLLGYPLPCYIYTGYAVPGMYFIKLIATPPNHNSHVKRLVQKCIIRQI